ncbi:MAG: transcriptional regulator [Lachnospiraceae bacterium]|nr:transcriptional regulator [Lachnospiraceae bacterium]
MSLTNIGPETETIEYKKSTGEMKEAMLSIAAILNKHQKGQLFFGVKNDGTVIGQIITEESLRKVSQAIGNHIAPAIYPEIKVVRFGERDCIQVNFEGNRCPYLAYHVPRIRVADEDLVMDQDTYDEMIRKRDDMRYSWEQKVSEYTIEEVSQDAFREYLQKAKDAGRIIFEETDIRTVLNKLELMKGEYLLNAGAALFCSSGINELQMAKFASNERLTFTDIRRFTGSIIELAKKAEQYIIDAMDWRVEIGAGLSRKEIPEIPMDAIREAIINSFGHKLFGSGQSNEVAIFKDRIEIYNPGPFPVGLTPEMFIDGKSRPVRRNPLITRTLYYSKDMESFATGLKRISTACKEAGCQVKFEQQQYGFAVIFYRKKDNLGNDTQVNAQVNAQAEIATRILQYCQHPRSKKEIADYLGYKSVKSITTVINVLLETEKLARTVPDKPHSRNQKYLTKANFPYS